jgi:hypothetical protein
MLDPRENQRLGKRSRRAPQLASALGTWLVLTTVAWCQPGNVHYRHDIEMPPGAIGQGQLLRGGPRPGYFQPVEVRAPEGAAASFAVESNFGRPESDTIVGGMLIGQVYRLRVTQIPQNEGLEVYPTIEVIDRLYPPAGQKARFPIPIELTLEELELALDGRMVTRVIYLEDPDRALPRPEHGRRVRYFDVSADRDPLEVADELGRPVAILRMGSRAPVDIAQPSNGFLFGCPPIEFYRQP